MHELKGHRAVLFQARFTSVRLILLVLLSAFVAGCDEVERHKVVTFFFDGVPSVAGEKVTETDASDPNSRKSAQMRPKLGSWYVHELREPQKKCTVCHGKRRQRGFSRQAHLIAPVPKLCYDCHTDYTVSSSFVHGPVAVGQCLFCHNHHKSKIEHLLKEPEPKLCHQCHDINAIKSIPDHLTQLSSACTDCHEAHASSIKYLLKVAAPQTHEEPDRARTIGAVVQDQVQAGKGQRVLRMVSKLIEQDQLEKARAYLEEIKDSSVLTDEERRKISQVLRLLYTWPIRSQALLEKTERQGSVTEEKPEQQAAGSRKADDQQDRQIREIAELYYRSLTLYRAGRLVEAREGFVKVLKSGLVPPPVVRTIRGYLTDIDSTLANRQGH